MPLALVAVILAGGISGMQVPVLAVVAGLGALLAGAWLKFTLVTRAAFNQGFALHAPAGARAGALGAPPAGGASAPAPPFGPAARLCLIRVN